MVKLVKKLLKICYRLLRVTLVVMIVMTAIMVRTLRSDISELTLQLHIVRSYFDKIIASYTNHLKDITKINQKLIETDIDLYSKIKQIVKIMNESTLKLEELSTLIPPNYEFLERTNLSIVNYSRGISGSGTLISLKGSFYVLTAAHLLRSDKDFIMAQDNVTGKNYPLSVIKFSRKYDLAIFDIKINKDDTLTNFALDIGHVSPSTGDTIYIIGNPDSYEDILTSGIIVKKGRSFSLVSAPIYFGNSGGAVIYKGKLVGVVSALSIRLSIQFLEPNAELWWLERPIPYFIDSTFGIVVNLEVINRFLKDVQNCSDN